MRIKAAPLTPQAFAPFGQVLQVPARPGRAYFDADLANGRPEARPSISLSRIVPIDGLPLRATMLERHEHSSQSFVPISVGRWLVVVAPPAQDGGPDAARARAFIAGPGQGVTYRMGAWHHGMTVLDREAEFAVFMWRDGSPGDEEFVPLAEPLDIVASD